MKIVCISDVHGRWNKINIPECDLLISAGDYSFRGEKHIVKDFHAWLDKQPARHVISVQGNHEMWVEKNWDEAKQLVNTLAPRIHFIQEGLVEIEGVKIWGSAITPWFHDWAWNRSGRELEYHWSLIPNDINVLVTHGPPYEILDTVYFADGITIKERVGCYRLSERIKSLPNLKLHVFGHIHSSAGEAYFNGVKYINAAICDEMYMATNPIREFEL